MATNATVTITYDPTGKPPITVTPNPAYIEGPGKAIWTVNGLPDGTTVEIAFTSADRCPFGTYKGTNGEISTAAAAAESNGQWNYTVSALDTDKGTATADGAIVIDRNP
jgi:hypothetical protein